jgi:hypothetical protein
MDERTAGSGYTYPASAHAVGENVMSQGELRESIHAPKPGGTKIILQVNPSDREGRKLSTDDEQYGALDDGAAECAERFAMESFNKILSEIPEGERQNVRVIMFASPAELIEPTRNVGVGHHKRAVQGAEASLAGIEQALQEHDLPVDIILNRAIAEPKGLNDLNVLTESPEYIDYVIAEAEKKNPDGWSGLFWQMIESDETKAKYVERQKGLGIEVSPDDIEGHSDVAERMDWQLSLIARSMNYVFDENPNTRLIIYITAMYDNISPYLQHVAGDDWHKMEKGAGVAIDYDPSEDKMTTSVMGKNLEYYPHQHDEWTKQSNNVRRGVGMESLEPISGIRIADMLEDNEPLRKVVEKLKRHKHGRFILGPSGVGKTTFTESQIPDEDGRVDWLDADAIWYASGALPPQSTEWWRKLGDGPGEYDIAELDRRCDEVTRQAKEMGLWLIGASDDGILPDAIIVPDWEQHVAQIAARESDPKEYARLGGGKNR